MHVKEDEVGFDCQSFVFGGTIKTVVLLFLGAFSSPFIPQRPRTTSSESALCCVFHFLVARLCRRSFSFYYAIRSELVYIYYKKATVLSGCLRRFIDI